MPCDYLKATANKDVGPSWSIVEHKSEIVDLFKRAGQTNPTFIRPKPIGYLQILNQPITLYENIAVADKEIVAGVLHRFHASDGVFTKRIRLDGS